MEAIISHGFKYLSVEDRDIFTRYYEKMDQECASSVIFSSMIAWNVSIKVYYKIIGEFICCVVHDTNTRRWVLLPLFGVYDRKALEQSVTELKKIMDEMKLPIIFTDISEWMLPYYENLNVIKLKASFDIGLSDYIYRAEDFVESWNRPGSRYDYNHFIKKNNPKLVVMKNENIQQYEDYISEVWCNNHSCDFCQYGCLMDSEKRIISVVNQVGAYGITVYVDKKIVGYTIVSLEWGQLTYHFKKGIHRIRGLSEYMHKNCFELFGKDARIINYTEDINIEGLRKYKQNIAKYTLNHKYELNCL